MPMEAGKVRCAECVPKVCFDPLDEVRYEEDVYDLSSVGWVGIDG